jgi:hypothetical protein
VLVLLRELSCRCMRHRHLASPTPEKHCLSVQVCTLSAGELRLAAAAQLGAWLQQQPDLELAPCGFEVVQVGGCGHEGEVGSTRASRRPTAALSVRP